MNTRIRSAPCRAVMALTPAMLLSLLLAAGDAQSASQRPPPASQGSASVQGSPVACTAKKSLAERLEFASADRASKILGRPNEWVRQLSEFDRGARMHTLDPTTRQDFLAFASDAGLEWLPHEQAWWSGLAERLSDALAGMNLKVPHIHMVKTTGLEEFDSAYTRDRSIMLPEGRIAIAGNERRDFFLLAHELFHVLSYENPAQRHELYSLLEFLWFPKFDYPSELEERRVSNPQAYHYDYALPVATPDGPAAVTPVFQITVPLEELLQFPPSTPHAIFSVADFVLLPVNLDSGAVLRDGNGELIRYSFANTSWVPQMLRNSSYIIHPEELMADNFALLMEWRSNGVPPIDVPGGPGEGFPVNDFGLLEAIERVLTAGCGE